MRTHTIEVGQDIYNAAKDIVFEANRTQCDVQADFNGILLTAKPGADVRAITAYYHAEHERRYHARVRERATVEATFANIDFEDKTLTFTISPEDVGRFRWKAGKISLDVSPITVPNEKE